MAKKAMIEREKKRARLVNRYAAKRAELKEIAKKLSGQPYAQSLSIDWAASCLL